MLWCYLFLLFILPLAVVWLGERVDRRNHRP